MEISSTDTEVQTDLSEPGFETPKRKKPAPQRGNRSQSSTPIGQKTSDNLTTQPTTPFDKGAPANDLPAELYVAVLQRRVLDFARLKTDSEREEGAVRLVPALVRSVSQSTLLAFLNSTFIKAGVSEYRELVGVFNDGNVWRKALRRSFPTFCRDFIDCEQLPQFFENGKSASSSTTVPSSPTLSEKDEEPKNSSAQWSTYYYLVYQLFTELLRVTVVATQRAPEGDWREFFSTQHETTFSLLLDTPEDAFVVTPEQFGIIGDVYDVALSTFRPLGTLSQFDIVRWYGALPMGFNRVSESVEVYRNIVTQRDRTLIGQTRYFVYHTQEQFVRTRFVLQTGTSQWWHERMRLDAPMADHVTAELIEKRRASLRNRLQHNERELRRLRQELKRMVVENSVAAKNLRDLAFANITTAAETVMPSDSDDDDDNDVDRANDVIRSVGSTTTNERDVLLVQQLIDHKKQRVRALSDQSSEDESELLQLDSLLSRENDSSLEVLVYEIAAVTAPIEQAPLIAGNFALLRSPVKAKEPSSSPRNNEIGSSPIGSPHEIVFSDSDNEDNEEGGNKLLATPIAARVSFRPEKLDKRITYQSKFRVRLTHVLRYFTGWKETGPGYSISFEFGIVPQFNVFTESELFSPVIGNFIWYLALSQVKLRERERLGNPAQEMEADLLPDEERTLHNSAETYQTVRDYVEKRAYPNLAAYVDAQTL